MQKKDVNIPYLKRPISPDRELLLWEKWIQIRREETTELGEMFERPPVDLAMNLLANVREDKERKEALEYAQIEHMTATRGSLWVRPPRLKQHCYCLPVYEVQRTMAEKGRPPIVEHIGVPTYIRENELGMSGEPLRQPCYQLDADYVNYRQKREHDLSEQLMKIDPFRPEIDGLIVRGKKPSPPPPKLPPLPEIIIEDDKNAHTKTLTGVYALKINNTVLYKPTEVHKMKELYKEMVKGEEWDLSIASWREKMMAKEFDDRMKYYELLRHSHEVLLKPWYEGDDLIKEKLRTIKCLLSQYVDLFDKEYAKTAEPLMEQRSSETKAGTRCRVTEKIVVKGPINEQMWHSVFFLRMYDHLATTIELCAGVLSSLDLNRWIEFDFCQH
ncbi:hypothetical protein PYW07_001822 [Mythimna separata]|uniref:Uncharacterized protein n=1 Tax=Mythimna separata TaxID=271217 RepID=A0AAD7YUM1_MYTSE|nr:hypothetical protein PYW07_001822 [Mythimna separata]